jgi:HAMP domain-containing protein
MSQTIAALAGSVIGYGFMAWFNVQRQAKRADRTMRRLHAMAVIDETSRRLASRYQAGEITIDEWWTLDCQQTERTMRAAG